MGLCQVFRILLTQGLAKKQNGLTLLNFVCLGVVFQELVDGGLMNQLSPPTSDLISVLTQLLIPPTEVDGTILGQKCTQINKALEVLSGILFYSSFFPVRSAIQFNNPGLCDWCVKKKSVHSFALIC